jgi:hypothetical protein
MSALCRERHDDLLISKQKLRQAEAVRLVGQSRSKRSGAGICLPAICALWPAYKTSCAGESVA